MAAVESKMAAMCIGILLLDILFLVGQSSAQSACSVGCPAGHFEARPCSNQADRVCKECTACSGSMYEIRPCTPMADRECKHVAHPVLITANSTTPSFLEDLHQRKPERKKRKRLKVEASANVFMEDLHNTRNLETTTYITDSTAQAFDFHYERESRLQVNIGILDVHLIPTYEDVNHDGDDKYMKSNPNMSEDKKKFQEITNRYCRNPIPDYYSITLEIARDRTTAATMLTCDPSDANNIPCPENVHHGDSFLHRTLNDACTKMGTFPEPQLPAANSIVCTDNTALLREVFNQTYSRERPIPFPPRRCRTAMLRCDQCLQQSRCRVLELFEQKCCQIDCYTLPDCKLAQSDQCSQAAVECAMGDAYRYTIQPVFSNIKSEYQCHLRHQKPEVLYQMFFYVEIPDTGFQTPKVYRTVYARDLEYQSHGEYQADYITVEHATGLDLSDEFVLVGKELSGISGGGGSQSSGGGGYYNFSVSTLKTEEDYKKKRVVVHEISHNIFVASTQFERPFDYSTSSWVKDNQCNKNVSKFKNVQPHYRDDAQGVNVVAHNTDDAFKYWLQPKGKSGPYIRFTVPGNTSVLPWYFKDEGPVLLTNESLQVELELLAGDRIWNIHLRGKLSDCPGYVGITINNRLELEELFRYDLLVLCPSEFNMTFHIPNFGQKPGNTFDVQLVDAKKSYEVYLTHLTFEQHSIQNDQESQSLPKTSETSGTIFAIVAGTTGLLLLIMMFAYIHTENTKSRAVLNKSDVHSGYYGDQNSVDSDQSACFPTKKLSHGQGMFIALYIILRILYSLVFTFSVFFALVLLFVQSDFSKVSHIVQFQTFKNNESQAMTDKVNAYGQSELLRQAELVTKMQESCSFYIEELFDSLAFQMDNITANQHHLEMYDHDSSSISFLMQQRMKRILAEYERDVGNYSARYDRLVDESIKPSLLRYRRYLNQIYASNWLNFPQKLFNESSFVEARPKMLRSKSELSGTEVDFGAFLEIEEVEEVQLWPVQFWERFEARLPEVPVLPVPQVDALHPRCALPSAAANNPSGASNYNVSSRTPLHHLDSARYFAGVDVATPPAPAYTSTSRGRGAGVHSAEEYKFLPSSSSSDSNNNNNFKASQNTLTMDDLGASVNTDVLRIIFLVLDAILLLYRFSHTYINATMLCRGFEESVSGESLLGNRKTTLQNGGRSIHRGNHDNKHKHEKEVTFADTPLPDYSTAPLDPRHSKSGQQQQQQQGASRGAGHNGCHGKSGGGGGGASSSAGGASKWMCRETVAKILQSNTVPKILIAAAMLVLFYIVVATICAVVDVDVILAIDGFNVFLQGLDIQVNQTNWYLVDQAEHFNQVTMTIYQGQMRSELLNLQSMLDYFTREQKRLLENYRLEACAVKKQHAANWTCDLDLTAPKLQLPLLPCNFIPIQPHLFTGFALPQYEQQLSVDLEPYFGAVRHVTLWLAYAVLVTVATMFVIHICGAVLFHYLKCKHKFPVRTVIVSSSPPGLSGGEILPPPPDESDYETDDDQDGGFRTYPSSNRGHCHHGDKSNTLLTDFKYSETKV